MIDATDLRRVLVRAGVRFFSGVPDSLLSSFVDALDADGLTHVVAANEGGAVATCAGHYLATGELGAAYLQNSGLGNAVNPLASLMARSVYAIPCLLIVGWRGEPGAPDEPQHALQGRITLPLLAALEVESRVLPDDVAEAEEVIAALVAHARAERVPVALVVKKGTVSGASDGRPPSPLPLDRARAIECVAAALPSEAVVVGTTGYASRELFELEARDGLGPERAFLNVGAMGHASQIALGLALGQPSRSVVCFDGDGAAVMHLGGLVAIGRAAPTNLIHVVLDNGVHDSVGGAPSASAGLDFARIAAACGYRRAESARDEAAVLAALSELLAAGGPSLLVIAVRPGARPELARVEQPLDARVRAMRTWLER